MESTLNRQEYLHIQPINKSTTKTSKPTHITGHQVVDSHLSTKSGTDFSSAMFVVDEMYDYRCHFCAFTCSRRSDIVDHIQTHPEASLTCDFCDKQFQMKSALQEHLAIHGTSDLRCSFCAKDFQTSYNFKRHIRLHRKPLFSLICQICQSSFREKRYMTQHMVVHKEPRFSCQFCGKKFCHKQSLHMHEHICSSNKKPHQKYA